MNYSTITVAAIIPKNPNTFPQSGPFTASTDFNRKCSARSTNRSRLPTLTLVKVPFDLAHWQKVAAEKYPHGLPKPLSSDPTQWLFNGHPKVSDQPFHVAVARLLGYRWPRQTGSSFPDCPALGPDGLEKLADDDGIVCLSATKGEAPAAERLRGLAGCTPWAEFDRSSARLQLPAQGQQSRRRWRSGCARVLRAALRAFPPAARSSGTSGTVTRDGFRALVNYHRLTHANLEKLTYAYLGDWIRAPAGRRRRRRGRQRRPPASRQAIAGPPQAHPRRRAALRHLRPLEAALTNKPSAGTRT